MGWLCISRFWLPRARFSFEYYAQINLVYPFVAKINGVVAGGGTCAIDDSICNLGVTSTLAPFRGQGIQKALLNQHLLFSKSQGLTIATVTTEPGSISDLNIQKIGFNSAYTRLKHSRKIQMSDDAFVVVFKATNITH